MIAGRSASSLVALLLAAFALHFSAGEAVKCYICSWSLVENQTDFCTDENFQPEAIKNVMCGRGCEIISNIDDNGDVVDMCRKCARLVAPRCRSCNETIKNEMSRNVCSCNRDFCNGVEYEPNSAIVLSTSVVFLGLSIAAALSNRS